MFTHFTVIPVLFVNWARAAFGTGSAARATVIVTPLVLVEPAELPPPPLHPAAARTATARPAAHAPRHLNVGRLSGITAPSRRLVHAAHCTSAHEHCTGALRGLRGCALLER